MHLAAPEFSRKKLLSFRLLIRRSDIEIVVIAVGFIVIASHRFLNPMHVVGRKVEVSQVARGAGLRKWIVLLFLQHFVHWYLLIRKGASKELVGTMGMALESSARCFEVYCTSLETILWIHL